MIALFVLASYSCELHDTACWRGAALQEEERAERAELKSKLLDQAVKVVERSLADEVMRGDRWKETALKVAPKAPGLFESPYFWMGIGLLVGAAATVGVLYSVSPAFNSAK